METKLEKILKSINRDNAKIEIIKNDKSEIVNVKFNLEKETITFDDIARILLTETAIKKGAKLYYITNIEFYLYCDEHKDIITYPRNCDAGEWFFHSSGVDICFNSENIDMDDDGKIKVPNEKSFFGGILIRGIKLVKDGDNECEKTIKGSLKVTYELFDKFSAFEIPNDFPVLQEEKEHSSFDKCNKTFRYHMLKRNGKLLEDAAVTKLTEDEKTKLSKDRAYEVLKNNYVYGTTSENIEKIANEFCKYSCAKYRYYIDESQK